MRNVIAVFATSLTLLACSSIDGHRLVHDSNGAVTDVEDVGGMPIVVQTPTRALFVLTRNRYRATRITMQSDDGEVTMRRESLGELVESTLSEAPVLLGPSEVYTIDPKRPAAGTVDYELELDGQYPKRIKGVLDDDTIEQLRQLAKDLAETALQAAGVPAVPAPGVVKESGAVSVEKELVASEVSLVLIDLRTGDVDLKSLE